MMHGNAKIKLKFTLKFILKLLLTYFGLRPSSGNLHMSLVKVTFIKSVKIRRYGLCGCVAACYIKSMVVCVLCAVQSETFLSLSTVSLLRIISLSVHSFVFDLRVGVIICSKNIPFNNAARNTVRKI